MIIEGTTPPIDSLDTVQDSNTILMSTVDTSAENAFAAQVLGAETSQDYNPLITLQEKIETLTLPVVGYGFLLLLLVTAIAILVKKQSETLKRFFFWSMTSIIVVLTVGMMASTVFLNMASWSGGPVHWHADFQVWACGEKIDLKDPKGFLNRIGTSVLHEHNDERIHYEGVIMTPQQAMLDNFFHVIGGELTANSLTVPTNNGIASYATGDSCSDGSTGTMQVFAYQVNDDKTFTQRKLTHPENYVLSQVSTVPPGDCLIVEFGEEKDRTDKLCLSYEAAVETGKLQGETDARH